MAVELGEEDPRVTLDHFVRLFVNHRSVFDIERKNFEEVVMSPRCTKRTAPSSLAAAGFRDARDDRQQFAP
jgi:hypothetical protein